MAVFLNRFLRYNSTSQMSQEHLYASFYGDLSDFLTTTLTFVPDRGLPLKVVTSLSLQTFH